MATMKLETRPVAAATRVAGRFRGLDPVLLGVVVALTVIGVFAIYSATHDSLTALGLDPYQFVMKQLVALAAAGLVMLVAASFDYRRGRIYVGFFYAAMVVALLLVRTPLGQATKGSQRGFYLGEFQFTPSELMKIALIVTLAGYLASIRGGITIRDVVRVTALALVPMALVFLQPDIGTTIVLATILVAIVVVAGARTWHMAFLAVTAAILMVAAFQLGLVKEYQIARLTGFLDPVNDVQAADYNRLQSVIAMGNGGWNGTGYLQGPQTNLDFVPEQHTDFIFTVVGEEFGFLGAAGLLLLFAVLLWRAYRIATLSRDRFGTYIAIGVAAMIAIQVFVNVGMTLGIMPITGIPLPFVSYGGSSLVANYLAVGLLLNVYRRRAAGPLV
jgi:rod shape determining protein RodA